MFNLLSFLLRRSQRHWLYPLLSILVSFGLVIATPLVSQAISWGDLILRGVQIMQVSNISDNQEVALGKQINSQISREIRLNRNPGLNTYINQIGQRLAKNSERPKIPYTFQVVEDKSINAFATMGGFVYIHTGLLKAADNEAEVASVLAHEIGHITGRHVVRQMRQSLLAQGIAEIVGANRNIAVQLGVELGMRRPKSREFEYEADQKGFQNLGKANYAQSAMVTFMQKLMKQGSSAPTILSTHPPTQDRVTRLQKALTSTPSNNSTEGLDNVGYKDLITRFVR